MQRFIMLVIMLVTTFSAPAARVVRYEDGSGTAAGVAVDAGTLAWDCARDGNEVCG